MKRTMKEWWEDEHEVVIDWIFDHIGRIALVLLAILLTWMFIHYGTGEYARQSEEFHNKCVAACKPYTVYVHNHESKLCKCDMKYKKLDVE